MVVLGIRLASAGIAFKRGVPPVKSGINGDASVIERLRLDHQRVITREVARGDYASARGQVGDDRAC
jgi:hypothetical protein